MDGVAAGEPKHRWATAAAPHASTRLAITAPGSPSGSAAAREGAQPERRLDQAAGGAGQVRPRGPQPRRAGRHQHHREVGGAAVERPDRVGQRLGHVHRGREQGAHGRRHAGRDELRHQQAVTPGHEGGDEQHARHDRREEVEDLPHRFEAAGQAREHVEDGRLDPGECPSRRTPPATTTAAAMPTRTMSLGRRRTWPSATIPNTDEPQPRCTADLATACASAGSPGGTSAGSSRSVSVVTDGVRIPASEAEQMGRSAQPTRGDLVVDPQLHSRPTGSTRAATRDGVTYPRTFSGARVRSAWHATSLSPPANDRGARRSCRAGAADVVMRTARTSARGSSVRRRAQARRRASVSPEIT